jgi:hypothetical protein
MQPNPIEFTDKIRNTFPTFFTFVSLISPYLLILLLLLNSIINSNIKGLIYFCGVIILFISITLLQNTVKFETNTFVAPSHCKLFSHEFQYNRIPSFNSALFIFTFVYIFIPMMSNNSINIAFLSILLILFAIDSGIRLKNQCTTYVGILFGALIGFIYGSLWYLLINSQSPSLLYYDDLLSNKVACSRPTKQQFKCSVYKNGELLKSI